MTLRIDVRLALPAFALDVDLELEGHVALVGPNGSGKTTLLDAASGLRRPDDGHIALGGEALFERRPGRPPRVDVPASRRGIGYVLQDAALFPHLTVAGNVAYPLRVRRRTPADADALLARFGLEPLRDRLPRTLSAGERQRAAVARALAAEPRWLLLDEPFAALDAAARPAVRADVLAALDERGVPALVVTHDPAEALALGGRVLVLEQGRVVDDGPPGELLRRPASAFGAALAGLNVWVGRVAVRRDAEGVCRVAVDGASLAVPADAAGLPDDGPVALALPPEEVVLARAALDSSARNVVRGRVESIAPEGDRRRVRLTGTLAVTASVTPAALADLRLGPGDEAVAFFKASALRVV